MLLYLQKRPRPNEAVSSCVCCKTNKMFFLSLLKLSVTQFGNKTVVLKENTLCNDDRLFYAILCLCTCI